MTNSFDEKIVMSDVGGINTSIVQDVVTNGQVYELTYYKTPTGYLVPDPERFQLGDVKSVRALKTQVRNKLWQGRVLGVTIGRDPTPLAYIVPVKMVGYAE